MISGLLFKKIFLGREKKLGDTYKKTFHTERLMKPGYDKFFENTKKHIELLKKMPKKELSIKSNDGLLLRADLYLAKNSQKTAILCHGYNSSGLSDFATIGYEYLMRGYNTLFVANRGSGISQGKYVYFGVKESEDTLLWIDEICKTFSGDVILHGISMGGATVCMLSDKKLDKKVKAIISDCAFTSAKDQFLFMNKKYFHLPKFFINRLNEKSKKVLDFDFTERSALKSVRNANLPILFIHGSEDAFVPLEHAQILYDNCTSSKELLIVEGYGHAQAHMDKDTYFSKLFLFIDKYAN